MKGVQILQCRAPISKFLEGIQCIYNCLPLLRLSLYASMLAGPSPTKLHKRSMYMMGISD